MSALPGSYRGTGKRARATLYQKIFALLALLLLGMAMPTVAQANECRMADPNSKGAHVDEICWLQLDGVTLNANGSTPLTFNLPDGSSMTFTVDVSNVGASAGLKGVQAPSWTGSQFSGSTGYYTIYKPNTAALYTNSGSTGNDTTVALRDIHLFGPSGVESTNAFEMVVADGESTNSNEYLDFGVVSGGSAFNLVEWLGASAANNLAYGAPGSAGVPSTPTSACAGMIDCIRMVGKSGTANAVVFSTTRTGSPFTVLGQVHTNSSSLQGFAFGVRWGGVRLRKALPNGRLDGSDQFTYRVINVKGQEIINTSTTGAATGNYAYISGQATMPGNVITLKEEMAPGSKSTLDQYDRNIVCSNGNPGSATALPSGSFDPANPPKVDLQQLGDRVDCTLSNIPRLVDLKLVKSAPATVQAGQPLSYTLAISNNGTHTATGATFTDSMPVGVTGVSAGGVSCGSAANGALCGALGVNVTGSDAAGYTITGAIQSLPANGSVVVTINATAPISTIGTLSNTATVKLAGTDTTVGEPTASTGDNTSTATTTVQGTPALQVSKTATLNDANGNAKADAGETISYAITATNSGNLTLNGLTVSDPMAGGTALACSPTSIDPGKTANCGSFVYTVTQADVDAGVALHNVATITGTPPGGGSPVTSTGTTDTPIGDVQIVARNDSYSVANGANGGSTGNVVGNDQFGAVTGPAIGTTKGQVALTWGSVGNPPATGGFTLNGDGTITVKPGTPAGTYKIPYTLCDAVHPANCANAEADVTVGAAAIVATPDSYSGIDGGVGQANAGNVLDNDSLNGAKTTPSTVNLTVTTPASNPNVKLDPATGEVSVAPGTPAGTYTITYQICEKLNPSNCASTTASVTVAAGKIAATNDNYTGINSNLGNPHAGNVLDNDTLNGSAAAISTVALTVTAPASNPNVKLDPATGEVSVAPGTPAGTYTIGYSICEKLNPSNCATATATATVVAGPITAGSDSYSGVSSAGNPSVGNALDNDTLNGAKATPATVNTTVTMPASNPNVKLDPATGNVSVAPGTPAGTYTIGYSICDKINPASCASATIQVIVAAGKIVATNDAYTGIDGGVGQPNAGNVLDNDTLDGVKATPSTVNLTVTTPASNPNVKLDPATGQVSVAPGTPAGTYSIGYNICEKLNPANCATATASVTVIAGKIVATGDNYTGIDGGAGNPSVGNVLDNDTLNGTKVTPSTVTVSITTPPSNPNVKLDPATGNVSVAPGTPAGTYTITYQICEKLNPGNCSLATASITVAAGKIVATDDSYTGIDGGAGKPNAGNVLDNDTLDGAKATPANVNLTVTTPASNPNVQLDPATGQVAVAPGTPAGTYSIGYTICEKLNPSNCKSAVATVAVVSLPLQAVNDDYRTTPINGATGGTPGKVLGNDTQGGAVIGDPGRVITTLVDNGGLRGASIGPDGSIIVPAGTARGTYTLNYRICDTLLRTNCSTASITLAVSDDALLHVSKQATPQTVKVGDVVRYTVTIQNPGKADVHQAVLADAPPVGFTLVADSLNVGTSGGRLAGSSPIRIEGIDVAAGKSISVVYLLRVGPGASARGEYVNTAQMLLNGVLTSNVAQATVQRDADPLFEDSRAFGTVFDDRNGDGWQASATADGLRVQGGFAPGAYIAGSTTVDRGQGPQPEADASAPLLHGIALGSLRGRDTVAQPENLRRIVVSQRLRQADFTGDFQLTSAAGTTLRLRSGGQSDTVLSGDAASGHSAEKLSVERVVTTEANGNLRVDYVIVNRGVDERGIPGVRIGTVEGNLIETDAYGRFHLEGIDVPNMARGRNFIMKVDPATLPPDSEFSTPNPQVKRITQGIPARFDFGVKLPEQALPAPRNDHPDGPPEPAATRGDQQTGGQP
ncbi:beta strand repeat-containing protein [Dyella sp. 2RAB6]|uniref:beta strand repeat-containing protein n=1 Tax=Dyella sp. 2RAB6 TaxID=3232992 RepID=UPI003F93F1BF